MIDVILNRELSSVLSALPLSKTVTATIEGEETEMAPYLHLAIAVEKVDVDLIEQLSDSLGISKRKLQNAYNEAQRWSHQIN